MRDGLKLRIPAVGNLFQCAQGRLVASNRFSGERSKYDATGGGGPSVTRSA